jgi:Holliday junction DNA helicase RuvB
LFVDEIHQLNQRWRRFYHPCIGDFELDLVIGEGPMARTVRINCEAVHAVELRRRTWSFDDATAYRFGIRLGITGEELHKIVRARV